MSTTGSVADITARLQKWLPSRWFPTQAVNADGTVPRIYAQLVSWATALAAVWSQIQYAIAQARLGTSTDGWLDLSSQDFFGGDLPRLSGETDPVFEARIEANLLAPANTRLAVLETVERVTGYPARVIQPWQPNDNARYGGSFYGYNRAARPGQYANGNQRYSGLVVCAIPAAGLSGIPRRGYGGVFYTINPAFVPPAGAVYLQPSAEAGEQPVYDAINRVIPYGTTVFVKFVPPNQLP